MANKSEHSKFLFLLILVVIVLIGMLGILILKMPKVQKEKDVVSTPKSTKETSKDSSLVEPIDYVVYDFEDLEFQFVILEVELHTDGENVTLDHFTTEEGISLSSVQSYVTKLEANHYYLGLKDVWFSTTGAKKGDSISLFIPVEDKDAFNIKITSDLDDQEDITLSLKEKSGQTSDLYQSEASSIHEDGYSITFSGIYEIGTMELTQNGESYLISSQAKAFAITLNCENLNGDSLIIEDAIFTTSSGATYQAENNTVQSVKRQNLLGTEISGTVEGNLIFITYGDVLDDIGTLQIKLNNSSDYITVTQ